MKLVDGKLNLSATDLVANLNCQSLTDLNIGVATGKFKQPKIWDPMLDSLWERGRRHEESYIAYLESQKLDIVAISGVDVTPDAIESTIAAMKAGKDVIVQAALKNQIWHGRIDILRKVNLVSDLGDWSYEAIDTKLARTTKGGTVLQLSLYSELIAAIQGVSPEYMCVVTPWSDFEPERFRVADYAAYYRRAKSALSDKIENAETEPNYPNPVEHCAICKWRNNCDAKRRVDDHLSLVANISKLQIEELKRRGLNTATALSEMPLPMQWKPSRGSVSAYERVREQARVQIESRNTGERVFELLPHEAGFGLARLPEPSDGDIFLDLEGDAFVGENGLEYLFGYAFKDETGEYEYVGEWALNRSEEKQKYDNFIDFVMERWVQFPNLHIYHYGGYEPGAMKRLMGRYASREDELDRLLRGLVFVDLYGIVRQSVRASVESYSIKKMEPFYGFKRDANLADANLALTRLQTSLELNELDEIFESDRVIVQKYNQDDCNSTIYLRDWLEGLRVQLISNGVDVARPIAGDGTPSESVAAWLERIQPLMDALLEGVSPDVSERTQAEQGKWILANLLEWHRREEKGIWWEFYRLKDLNEDELLDEKSGLSGLEFQDTVGGTAKCPIHRYSFPIQDADLRSGKKLHNVGGNKLGEIVEISNELQHVDIKKRGDSADIHPGAVYTHEFVGSKPMQDSLIRLAEYVIQNGIEGIGEYQAARDILLNVPPRITGEQPIQNENEIAFEAAKRVALLIDSGVFPIQGPPGTGKTFTGGHMICELVAKNKKVGIVANSHTVIRNLLDGVVEASDEVGIEVQCIQKPKVREDNSHKLRITMKTADLFKGLDSDCDVAGGTAWLWSSPEAFESVDVLFVDEAAQMSLANVLAVSQAAPTVVLLGDPQQLDQPMQGNHPDGTGCSALEHILGGEETISPEKGLFLEKTWRLPPSISAYVSDMFYDGKLASRDGLEIQVVKSDGDISGSGLRFFPVEHDGNQSSSPEEAEKVAEIVTHILANNTTWIDRDGDVKELNLEDILIIAPYNAQVFEIQKFLPDARVGTVDKFQGQEAPIAIYSLTTSSYSDAPRGMEFLYSANRLNVATSRAQCISIIVGNPQIFNVDCKTPRQMKLANAFCRFLELAI